MFSRFILIFSFIAVTHAQVIPDSNPRPRPWPARMWKDVVSVADDVGYSLTQVLFDQIDKFEVKIFRTNYVEAQVKMEREVYNNNDILNSYSVVDYTSLNFKSKDIKYDIPGVGSNLSLGLSLEIGTGVDFINIRQVFSSKYPMLPTLKDEYPFLEDDGEVRTVDTNADSYIDPSWRPRTSELWNFVTIPFRIPSNLKKFNKLEDGELVSYGVNGYVELGANAGFNLLANQEDTFAESLGAKIQFKTYLKGIFRLTVLKENERFARVKITRAKERGRQWSVGGGAEKVELFEGFLIFDDTKMQTRLLETKVNIVPFKFSADKKYSRVFDLGFRYDLANPLARDAFEKAVKGSFLDSIELNNREDNDGNVIVKRLFRRSSSINALARNYEFNLNIYKSNWGTKNESVQALISLEDGQHHVFKDVSSSNKDWRVLWGRYEKLNYNFTVSVDQTNYDQNIKNSLQLVAEANLEDSHTSGFEMANYIRNIRSVIGRRDILPDLPLYLPDYEITPTEEDVEMQPFSQMSKAQYRKSSFYYGFNIDQETLIKFINTPQEKMWGILEKAFNVWEGAWSTGLRRAKYKVRYVLPRIANVPLYLANIHLRKGSDVEAAKRIVKRWRSLQYSYQQNFNIKTISKLLANMFSSKYYGHELMKVILYSMEDIELDYFLVATNSSFGRIQERGRVSTNPEYLLNLTDENIGFERLAGGYNANPDTAITNLDVNVLADQSKVELSFKLDHMPKIIYFKVFQSNRLMPFYTIAELAYDNKSRFKIGENKLVLDKKSLNELSFRLGEKLSPNNFYNITLSSSVDGFSWSKIATKRFFYEEVLP